MEKKKHYLLIKAILLSIFLYQSESLGLINIGLFWILFPIMAVVLRFVINLAVCFAVVRIYGCSSDESYEYSDEELTIMKHGSKFPEFPPDKPTHIKEGWNDVMFVDKDGKLCSTEIHFTKYNPKKS